MISTLDDAPASVVTIKDAHFTAGTTATGTVAAQPDPKKKGPSGFRHTIQVEYSGELRAPELSPPALGTAKLPLSSSCGAAVPVASASCASPVAKGKEKNKTPQRPTVDVAHHSASRHVKTPPAPGHGSTSTIKQYQASTANRQPPMTPTTTASGTNTMTTTTGIDDGDRHHKWDD
ncbi:hypothetical protein SCLCIDRAFT_28553 [Scleroderma citrinum Foug A]|uniref:Uncharacterized protein n=1 Tax=Scleroderma citrinum Foug A TaxID=1036808 RepID=A0A0C3DNI4_9AGAM|nr:hypothetical protein SCLCIDRAFT_28553 [Scleroderma citrinum Foug A]